MSLRELLLRFELQNREIVSDFGDVFVLEPTIAFEEHRITRCWVSSTPTA